MQFAAIFQNRAGQRMTSTAQNMMPRSKSSETKRNAEKDRNSRIVRRSPALLEWKTQTLLVTKATRTETAHAAMLLCVLPMCQRS